MKNNVKFYREKHNLTQGELAEKSGLSLRTIQRIENGNPLKGFTLDALAKALEIERDQLLSSAADLGKVKLINTATLSMFLLPFGNICVPVILTYTNNKDKTRLMGKEIINVQIVWTIITSLILISVPFLNKLIATEIPLIIFALISSMAFNVYIIFRNAISLNEHSTLHFTTKIKLI